MFYRLRSLWRRRTAEAELHLERETGKLLRSGLPAKEARRRARWPSAWRSELPAAECCN